MALFRAGDAVEGDIYADIIQRRTTWGNGLRRLKATYTNVIARVRANEAQMAEAMDQRHQAEENGAGKCGAL